MNERENANHAERGKSKVPEYMKRRAQLFVRQESQIVEAPYEDLTVAQTYPTWVDKGPLTNGRRMTLLTRKKTYEIGEEVRVIHVVEVTESGHMVYVAGPKEPKGEYVDGSLVTSALPEGEEALTPATYDGAVLPSPAIDYNYEITTYTFDKPGMHEIYWELGPLRSNVLKINIVDTIQPEQ